jgi:two-component system, OmpR family, response regulator
MRVLLLEDDTILGEGLRDYLRAEGHVVDWFTCLRDLQAVAGEPYDAWLVDWQLPDGSGLDWLARQRAAGDHTPSWMLTARDRLAELAARLRALQRRGGGPAQAPRRFGDVELDLAARAASVAGHRVELTAREWSLLEALVRRPGRIVPKSDLERLLLGAEVEVQSNALEVHVSSVRRKLGRDLIETVRGLGYRIGASG